MGAFEIVCIIVGTVAAGHVGLFAVYAFEHVRFHRARLTRPADETWTPSVTIIVPCKGLELKLAEHLEALFQLRYPRYELCFVVESPTDPGLQVIHDLRRRFDRIGSRVVIAGLATDSGQKVHNLIQATRTVAPETEVLAFVDSDAAPHPEWLRRLVSRLKSAPRSISTGYRWFQPIEPTLPNLALAALNNLVLLLLGNTWFNLAWGGAWGIRRETFEELGLPNAWNSTLSDDLIVSRLAHAQGVRILYEPHCLSISPASTSWAGLIEFARRQFRILRVYTPHWWLASFSGGLLVLSLFVASAALTAWGVASGRAWWWPALIGSGCYLATALRIGRQLSGLRPYLNAPPDSIRHVERVSTWLWPIVAAGNWLLLASSTWGRIITWRGIQYRLDSPTQTTILARPQPAQKAA